MKEHVKIFGGSKLQILFFFGVPVLFATSFVQLSDFNQDAFNTLYVVITILITMFFSILTVLAGYKNEEDEQYEIVLKETRSSMDYSNIVSDGKNIDNIKMILFNMSMMCMFYHELAHIYRGHLGLYNVWKDEGSLEQHCLDIQTLEWDADNYAATQMADWTTRVKKALLVDDRSDFAMKMACGAIHGMMYWQRQENDFCNISNKEHLPIFYR